jgi:hypothetical protein
MTSRRETAPAGLGRVNWRRFAIALLPSTILAVLLLVLTEQSVLAVSISISGEPFTVTATQLRGQGFEQFGVLGNSAIHLPTSNGKPVALAATAMRSATISHLCQVVNIGGIPMVITAGDGSKPVVATDLVVYADKFSGNASFKHLTLGQDASTLHDVPGVQGPKGAFALHATTVTISNLRQHAFATTAGTFTLPGFRLRFGGGC